ncbi:MAG TPA: hypothetical protein VNA20_15795 [Frankiaceae bacterium]|nr:hypothetical protein [Frankiaceae bacterium]
MTVRRRAAALAAAVAAAALAVATVPAAAHPTNPHVLARLDAVDPPLPDVVVEIRAGVADQLLVANHGDRPVEVLGTDGRPFLRIAKDEVEADVGSPDWHASLRPDGAAPPARTATRWVAVARGGTWAWFDHRLHAGDSAVTPELVRSRLPARLGDWAVPLRRGGATHTARGHVEYRPVAGAFRSAVTRPLPSADVAVVDGRIPGLFLRWNGSGTLLVKGIEGEPFARFSGTGVEVNELSATWRDDRALRGLPFATGAATAPRWTRHAPEPELVWLDRRLAYAPGVPPDAVLRRDGPTTMVEWDVPAEVDGRGVVISGETTWQPAPREPGGRNYLPIGLAAAVAVVGAVAAVGIRTRGPRG